jgi:hypothetical protein
MKTFASMAIVLAIATPALAQQIPPPTIFTIRSGETLQLVFQTSVTNDCTVTWDRYDDVDVLDGPQEITLDGKPTKGTVNLTSGKVCPHEVPGVSITIAAKDIAEPKEAKLTIRIRFHLRSGRPWQATHRYHLLMFPAADVPQASKQ